MAEEHGQEETSTHGVLLQAQGRREVRNSSERPSTNTGTSEGRSVACDLRISIDIFPSAEGKTATVQAVVGLPSVRFQPQTPLASLCG